MGWAPGTRYGDRSQEKVSVITSTCSPLTMDGVYIAALILASYYLVSLTIAEVRRWLHHTTE